jgi:hypothetical protein
MAWLNKHFVGKTLQGLKVRLGRWLKTAWRVFYPSDDQVGAQADENLSEVALADTKTRSVVKFSRGHAIFVTCILVLYYTIVSIWCSNEGPLRTLLVLSLRSPIDAIGIEQGWALFGPGVRTYNGHTVADITFADGSTRVYEFPRMEMMDLFEKLRREKLRKLFVDNMYNDGFDAYLPSLARCIAQANNDPTNPPVLVAFTLKWVDMPVPDEKKWRTRDIFPFHYKSRVTIVYKVKGDDLK